MTDDTPDLTLDPNDDDQTISSHVSRVKDEIALLVEEGLAQREGWFR